MTKTNKQEKITEEIIADDRIVTESEVKLEDLDRDSRYLSLKLGEELTLEISKILKVENKDSTFNLSKTEYCYEIHTVGEKILTISAWSLWSEIRAKLRDVGKIEGVILKIQHPKQGTYLVEIVSVIDK